MIKNYVLLVVSSIGLLFALAPLSSYKFFLLFGFPGQSMKAGLALLTYAALTFYWLRKERSVRWKILVGLTMLSPVLLGYLPMYVRDFERMQVSVPTTVAHGVGIFFGYVVANVTPQIRLRLVIGLVVSALWLSTQGYALWLHKLHYDSYFDSINEKIPSVTFRDENGSKVNATNLKGKLVVLEFWNTGCGNCFRTFPILEDYHRRYSKTGIQFYAVNIPLDRDRPQDARVAIRKKGYTFPALYAENRSLTALFKVQVYPTVVVIDSTKRIVYRGTLEKAESLFQ